MGLLLASAGGLLMVWLPYHREQKAIAAIERLGKARLNGLSPTQLGADNAGKQCNACLSEPVFRR